MGYIGTQKYRDPEIGPVNVTCRQNASSFKARWKGQVLHVTVPYGMSLEEYNRIFDSLRTKILESKPKAFYSFDSRFDFDLFSVSIEPTGPAHPRSHLQQPDPGSSDWHIFLPDKTNFANHQIEANIAKIIKIIAESYFPTVADEASIISEEIFGHKFDVLPMDGYRTLGHCSSHGLIHLSHALAFFDKDLRRLIICHEFAHLTHMDHSPAFHRLLDSYMGGRERALERILKAFAWPVPR